VSHILETGDRTNTYAKNTDHLQIRLDVYWILHNQMFVDEMAYFVNCLNQAQPTFNSVEQAIATLKIAIEVNNFGVF
jgi:hypothetical protein